MLGLCLFAAGACPHGANRALGRRADARACASRCLTSAAECLRCLFAVRGRTGQFAPWSGELTLALDREDSTRPRRGLCCALSGLAAGKKPACLGCNPPPLRNARRRHGPCGHAPAQSRRRLSHRTQMFPVAQARQRPDNCPGAFSARPAKRGRRRCAQAFFQESLIWK